MRAVFTCDDVFDVLTREPFPSGSADDEFVESHLAVCHECRQLAEAFRPAVGLFHESMAVESNDELPMYCGRLLPIIDALPQPTRTGVPPVRNSITMIALVIAASVMLVGSAVFATLGLNRRSGGDSQLASNVRLHENRDYTLLAALELPNACRSTTNAVELAAADIACCTQCHKAGSRISSTEKTIVKSAAACVACHDELSDEALSAIQFWQVPTLSFQRIRMQFREEFEAFRLGLAMVARPTPTQAASDRRNENASEKALVVSLDARIREASVRDFSISLTQRVRA